MIRVMTVEAVRKELGPLVQSIANGMEEAIILTYSGIEGAALVPVSTIKGSAKSAGYYQAFPHEAHECAYTCWRHKELSSAEG